MLHVVFSQARMNQDEFIYLTAQTCTRIPARLGQVCAFVFV